MFSMKFHSFVCKKYLMSSFYFPICQLVYVLFWYISVWLIQKFVDFMKPMTITCLHFHRQKKTKLKITFCPLGILWLSVQKILSCSG